MAKETTTVTVWTCDRCRRSVESGTKPSSAADPWGTLKIDQPGGWDFHGKPVAGRMPFPLTLCGACMEDVVRMVNGFVLRFDGPPGPEPGRFVEVEDHAGRSISIGEWMEEDGDWLLKMRPNRAPSEEQDHE